MIPKIIHYCWFGEKELPNSAIRCINSWKKYCPDYQIIQWNETNYDITKNIYMKEAYEARKWAFVPDYARLDIIYEYGGFYLDTDVELIKSLDSLIDNDGFMGFEADNYVAPGLGFGASKGNSTIKELMTAYCDKHFKIKDTTYDMTPNPVFNTEILSSLGLKRDNTFQIVKELSIFPKDYFCPMNVQTGNVELTNNTYSIHWYDSSWYTPIEHGIVKVERFFNKRSHIKVGKCFSFPLRVIRKIQKIGLRETISFVFNKCAKCFFNNNDQ